MTQTFRLKKGEILFENDKIIISDKVKIQRFMTLLTSGAWMIIGIISAVKYQHSNDKTTNLLWIALGIINFLLFVATISRSTKSLILLDDVKSIKVKQRFNNSFLDIKLKNNRLRRVSQIEDTEELEEYIETYYDGLTGK
jgi:hypothetical protein